MRNLLSAFAVFAPFALIAAIPLALVMLAQSQSELDVKAKDIIIQGKNVELAVAADVIKDKGGLSAPIVGKFKKVRVRK